jgi:hypothetical protein
MSRHQIAASLWGVSVVLLCAVAANAKTIPVSVTAGNITVGCSRVASSISGFDEVDFYLTGMLGAAAGLNTDGTRVGINSIRGRWTAAAGGGFWLPTNLTTMKTRTTNDRWWTPPFSVINFESIVDGSTVWTNTAADTAHGLPNGGGRDPAPTNPSTYGVGGAIYNFFSGCWYTAAPGAGLMYPANANYIGQGTNSTYMAALFVPSATPDTGIGYDGLLGFSYSGGTTEVNHFRTTSSLLAGDANGDYKVDMADLSVLLTNFDKTGLVWSQGDFDNNGIADMADLSKLLTNFDKTYGASAGGIKAVPEPSTIPLLLAGAIGLLAYARRRR